MGGVLGCLLCQNQSRLALVQNALVKCNNEMNVEMKHIPHSNAYHIHFNYIDPPTQLKVIAFSEVFTNKQDAENAVKLVKLVNRLEYLGPEPNEKYVLLLEVECELGAWYIYCSYWCKNQRRFTEECSIPFTTEAIAWTAIEVINTMRRLKSS